MDHSEIGDRVAELHSINQKDIDNYDKYDSDDQNNDRRNKQHSPFRRQAWVALSTFMFTLGAGATAGFSAILIPQLLAEGEHKYSTEMVSWVAAMSSMALVFGNLISGFMMEKFGRRMSHIILSLPFIIGWTIIGFTRNIYLILIGRFITGLCQGWLGPLGPVFVGEISSPMYRGVFLAGLSLAIATGVFMSHLFGTFLPYGVASLLCGVFPLLGCIIVFFAPESPAWLASQDRTDESIASFKWYRGDSPQMKLELEALISDQTKKDKTQSKILTLRNNIKKPEFWKPLGIMTTFFVITQLSGVNVICAYTPEMMKALIGNNSNEYTAMLSIDVLRCVSLAIACVLLRRLGRRQMAMFSGIFTSLSLITLAVYLHLVNKHVLHLSPIISLGLMAINMMVSNLGIVPLPWNMVGELFATETKGVGSGISVMMTSVAFFGTVKSAPAMFKTMNFSGTYLFYGVSTLLGTIFLYLYLPETKGRALYQIEEYFRYGKKKKNKHESRTMTI